MIDIFVDPPDWGGGFIVVTNVAHQLAGEILYRSEDTSGNNVTLNLREPNFDLVKPAGVGRGIVDPNCGVSLKKFKDFLGLVRAGPLRVNSKMRASVSAVRRRCSAPR
jgi:hypothetical protein